MHAQRKFLPILLLLLSTLLAALGIDSAAEPASPVAFIIVLLTITWIALFSVKVDSTRVDITHVLGFAYGLVEVSSWALIAAGTGLILGSILGGFYRRSDRSGTSSGIDHVAELLQSPARSILALTTALVLYHVCGGRTLSRENPLPGSVPFLAAAVGFSVCFLGLILVERRFKRVLKMSNRIAVSLSLLIVVPLPVAMLGATSYAILGLPALMIYCLLIGIAAPFNRQLVQNISLDEKLQGRLVELEGLEQFAESLAVALTSQDLHNVILDQAMRATKAQAGHLALFSGPDKRLVVVSSEPPDSRNDVFTGNAPAPEFTRQVASNSQPTRFDGSEGLTTIENISSREMHSQLGVPLLDPGGNLGAIVVERFTRKPFSDADQATLVRIASQAAGALRNARLYQELEQRLTEQSLLYQASMQIGETLETEAVALATADGLRVALKAHQVTVYQWQADEGRLQVVASVIDGRPVQDAKNDQYDPRDFPFMQACLLERKTQRWDLESAPTDADRTFLEQNRKGSSLLLAPLAIGQRTLGLLEVTSQKPGGFSSEAERIAQSIAIQAAIAFENTGLFQSTIEGHDRLMAIMNSTREGVIMIDLHGRMLLVNKLAGEFAALDHRAMENHLITDPELHLETRLGYQRGDIQNLLAALARGTSYYAGSNTFQTSKDDARFLQRNDSPVFDSDGDLIGWLIVLRDVTQQRELEQSRNQLTEMIVHDLRGPLTAILSGLTLLKTHIDEGPDSPVVEQAITVSERSVQQMLGLVNSLLTISNLESGSARLNIEMLDLATMLREIVEIYLPEANKSGIIIDLDVETIPEIQGDREKIARVFSNLIDNALKFTPTGGQVKLSLTQAGDLADIQIIDSGPGIPMEYRERIFDRYGQIPGTSGRRRGTGLGLAFCKLAVDAHDGRIWVEDSPAGGSNFHIQLPIGGPKPSQDN
ncbi:MAG: ATP-binding protein [Anaerolineales bacterium]|jgi:NtrC-family two-component system sensor histidine kinase KinB